MYRRKKPNPKVHLRCCERQGDGKMHDCFVENFTQMLAMSEDEVTD